MSTHSLSSASHPNRRGQALEWFSVVGSRRPVVEPGPFHRLVSTQLPTRSEKLNHFFSAKTKILKIGEKPEIEKFDIPSSF
jgi:hypothetical protein